MDKVLRDRWVEALRSEKYKQGLRALRNSDDCFCCLGLLCEISGRGRWEKYEREGDKIGWEYVVDGQAQGGILPYNFETELKLTNQAGTLIKMNDSLGKTFPEIADYIEKNL